MNDTHIARAPNNFDSLRLIFACLVILSHSFPLATGTNATEPLMRLSGQQITMGNISVWAFFAISGLLITQSWTRSSSIRSYLRRRIGRIYPGFLAAGLLTAIVVIPLVATPATYHPVALDNFVFESLQLRTFHAPPVFPHNPAPNVVNGSLWSIPYEFWCYIGVIFLGLTTALRRRFPVVVVFVLVLAFHIFLTARHLNFSGGILGRIFGYPPFWGTVLPFFLGGMLFHLYGGKRLLQTRWAIVSAVVLVASGFVPYGLIVTMPTLGVYLLMWLGYWERLRFLHLGRFGDFSYGTYLYGFLIQQMLLAHFGGGIGPWRLFAMALPLTLIAGALSWLLVEKHFLTRRSELRHEGAKTVALGKDEHTDETPAPQYAQAQP